MIRKTFCCDRCGKVITGIHAMHNNRYVGIDGNLMHHISKKSIPPWYDRQETLVFCQDCWARIFRAVKKVILKEDTTDASLR